MNLPFLKPKRVAETIYAKTMDSKGDSKPDVRKDDFMAAAEKALSAINTKDAGALAEAFASLQRIDAALDKEQQ